MLYQEGEEEEEMQMDGLAACFVCFFLFVRIRSNLAGSLIVNYYEVWKTLELKKIDNKLKNKQKNDGKN